MRMPRSDLALIYRGQCKERDRKATWVKYYLFVARSGKIALQAPALNFVRRALPSLRDASACRCVATSPSGCETQSTCRRFDNHFSGNQDNFANVP
jgi:hypothetical protein